MQILDKETWPRKEIYEFFSRIDYPFYSVTLSLDVTNVRAFARAQGLSFYHLLIWACTKALNRLPAFRLRIRGEDLVLLDGADPSFTSMRPGEEVFQIITLPWEADPRAFCAHAGEKAARQATLLDQAAETDELIYFSCTPWFDFTALTNEHNFDRDDSVPRLAWGKYYEEGGRLWVHLSVEVNHRLIDGVHLGQLKQALDEEIAALGRLS
ncbi:MAG TPA: chloramphenicol acetyltransferase [Candidatus Faecalibacterium intestinipullorum]|nr:chloramphenicol acetyltransferase [Candidatus Faecalibacterium intestinipullorum]